MMPKVNDASVHHLQAQSWRPDGRRKDKGDVDIGERFRASLMQHLQFSSCNAPPGHDDAAAPSHWSSSAVGTEEEALLSFETEALQQHFFYELAPLPETTQSWYFRLESAGMNSNEENC
jgi:hypothetical protein